MRLAAIINAWADTVDILPKCIDSIAPVADEIIVCWSERSNYGELNKSVGEIAVDYGKMTFHQFEPDLTKRPHQNETEKRNYGIEIAREKGCTHFIIMDADEFYIKKDLLIDKDHVEKYNLNGLVSKVKVMFKSPKLLVDDHTLVPTIQKLTASVRVGNYKTYPFTVDPNGDVHIDPTRRPSHQYGVEMSSTVMFHASWVRKDINMKILNSAARNNLLKSTIYEDLENAKDGYYCKFYRDNLVSCENYFNLPEYD